ncbi:MAG: hypothetical protein IPL40_11400 [Proteobacteria bacterium]|nr:hypothetical protein [Pseudomonadota bacterium]
MRYSGGVRFFGQHRVWALGLLPCLLGLTGACVRAGFETGRAPLAGDAGADRASELLTLGLRDALTGRSDRARSRTLDLVIAGDQGVARYCLTLADALPPSDADAPCVQGQGPAAGWWTARPPQFLLPAEEGRHALSLWGADAQGRVSWGPARASIILDTLAPPPPTLDLTDVSSGSALITATGAVNVTLGGDAGTSAYCLIETAADLPSPGAPRFDDPCFAAPPQGPLQLGAIGLRVVWAFARDEAWNVSATPGSARIEWRAGAALPAFVWVGRAGDAAFANPENWSTRVVPGAGDVARFDASCGARCDCTLGAPTSVAGLDLAPGYTGLLRQGVGQTLSVGPSGIAVAGGTLRGSESAIVVNGNVTLTGGRFESTRGTLSIGFATAVDNTGGLTLSGGVFVAGAGTVRFDGSKANDELWTDVARIDSVAPLQLNRLVVSILDTKTTQGQDGAILRLGATTRVLVAAELVLEDGKLVGGAIELRGNLTTTCAGAGVCAEGGLTPLIVKGDGVAQTYGGPGLGPLVVVDKDGSFEPAAGTTSYSLSGLKLSRGSFVSPTGTLRFHFDREYGLPLPHDDEGFRIVGGTFVNRLSALVINPWVSTEANQNAFPLDVGTLDVPTLLIDLDDYNQRYGFNNEWIGLAPGTVLRVAGRLEVIDGRLEGGRIEVGGDVAFSCASERRCAGGGSTELVLKGARAQSLYQQLGTYSAQLPGAAVLIDRPPLAPALRATSALRLDGPNQGLQLLSGALTTEGRALTVAGVLTLEEGTVLTLGGGALSYGALVDRGATVNP